MNKEEWKKLQEQELDEEYQKFLSSGLSLQEVIENDRKKQIAIELKKEAEYKKNTKKMLSKKFPKTKISSRYFITREEYKDEDTEQEYGEINYKRQRENNFNF